MVSFTLQHSFDMMNSNESVRLLFMIPVLLYKTSIDKAKLNKFDQKAFSYNKIDFKVYIKMLEGRAKC